MYEVVAVYYCVAFLLSSACAGNSVRERLLLLGVRILQGERRVPMYVWRMGAALCWKWESPGVVPFRAAPSARSDFVLQLSIHCDFHCSVYLAFDRCIGAVRAPCIFYKAKCLTPLTPFYRSCCPIHHALCLFIYSVLWLIRVIVIVCLYPTKSGDKPRQIRGYDACYIFCCTQTTCCCLLVSGAYRCINDPRQYPTWSVV
jgi:hypothetical protein